jgi:hypothetical protein
MRFLIKIVMLLALGSALLGASAVSALATDQKAASATTTPIKHLVVIF